jgi:hypothetical protein
MVVAGDRCIIGPGTYTDTNGDGKVAATVSGRNGTAGAPITIISETPLAAVISLPSLNQSNIGIAISGNYYTIDGFDFDGSAVSNTGLNVAYAGVAVYGGTGIIIQKNKIHDIGRRLCSNSVYGWQGIYVDTAFSGTLTIQNNIIHTIGRLYNGESGCATTIASTNDHGMYMKGGNGVTIQQNLIFDVTRGWPLHFYGGTVSNLNIYNNTFADKSPLGSSGAAGHILLASTVSNFNIKNNISHNPYDGMIRCSSSSLVSATNVVVDHSLTNASKIKTTEPCPSGVVFSNNFTSSNPGFVSGDIRNYNLAVGSVAIDAGVNIGLPYKGAGIDLGAYESGEQVSNLAPPKNLRVQ